MALDLPLVFNGGPQTRPWARVSSDVTNRYWSDPHRGHICRLRDPFRRCSLSSSIHVKSKLIQNSVSSELMHTVLQRIIFPQPVGTGACELAPTAVSLHGINIGSLPSFSYVSRTGATIKETWQCPYSFEIHSIRAFSNIGTSSPRFEKTAEALRTRREQYEMFLCS